MPRIRTIKPEFFRHEGLFDAERDTGLPLRVAFAGLWTAADRAGRFVWSPRTLKLDCLPYDDVDFSRVLDALATRGFIVKYTVDGREYGYIPSWQNHQVINNREKPSSLPEPNKNNTMTRDARVDDACRTPLGNFQGEGKGKGKEGKGREREKKDDDAADRREASKAELDQTVLALLLLTEFLAAMPKRKSGHPHNATKCAFRAAVLEGHDADAIIAAAGAYAEQAKRDGIEGTDQVTPADDWLVKRPWINPEPEWKRQAGYNLAAAIAAIAGRTDEFEMTGWNGAAHRCQTWLNEGWPAELILASVREQAARKSTKPSTVTYFEKGIADFIARQNAPLPPLSTQNMVPHETSAPANSWQASRDRGRAAHAKLKASIRADLERLERENGGGKIVGLLPSS